MIEEHSCGIIIFREEAPERLYLILHYAEGHYDFAKGHVERGETDKEAAFREATEETGIAKTDIELVHGFREALDYSYVREGRQMHKTVHFFLGRTSQREIRLSKEHAGYEWLGYEGAMNRLTYENARAVLAKAQRSLNRWGAGSSG